MTYDFLNFLIRCVVAGIWGVILFRRATGHASYLNGTTGIRLVQLDALIAVGTFILVIAGASVLGWVDPVIPRLMLTGVDVVAGILGIYILRSDRQAAR